MLDDDGVMFSHRFYILDQIFSYIYVKDVGLCTYVIYTDMGDGEPRRPCIILVMCKSREIPREMLPKF